MRTGLRSSRGQSLTEAALVFPVVLLILVGIVDLGRAFNAYITITNAAREGARYASMYPQDQSGIIAHVLNESTGSGVEIQANDVQVSATSFSPGNPIRVTVTYDFTLISGLILGGSTIHMQSASEMVILY